jgi:hypothetical protein
MSVNFGGTFKFEFRSIVTHYSHFTIDHSPFTYPELVHLHYLKCALFLQFSRNRIRLADI